MASRKSGKLCQFHGRPSLSTTSGMSSTPSIRFIEHVVLVFVARREAHATVAEQHGGSPVPRRRRQAVAPGHLRVVVRVHVDEARRDELAARVDLLGALGDIRPDRRDLAVDHGEIGFIGVSAGAIDDGAVADHQAGRGHAEPPMRWRTSYRQGSSRGKRLHSMAASLSSWAASPATAPSRALPCRAGPSFPLRPPTGPTPACPAVAISFSRISGVTLTTSSLRFSNIGKDFLSASS